MKTQKQPSQESDLPGNLAQPAKRALTGAGIHSLAELAAFTEEQVKQLHGIGPNALKQLRECLRTKGMSFNRKQKQNEKTKE